MRTKIIFLSLSFLFFSLILNVTLAEQQIVSGSNFDLYFSSGNELQFQHLSDLTFPIKVKVNSGVLNGTNATIKMYTRKGTLTFSSQDTATLVPTNCIIKVNNVEFKDMASIESGDYVVISWIVKLPQPYLPVPLGLGLGGMAMLCLTPLYIVYKLKHGEWYNALVWGFCMAIIGFGLVIGWLWG